MRCFSGTSCSYVANADNRDSEFNGFNDPGIIKEIPRICHQPVKQ